MLRSYKGTRPTLGRRVFIDSSAKVIGDVEIGDDSSVWMGSVLRGDVNAIRIGARTNIQDMTVIHVDYGELSTHLGDEVTVGHGAILHGCRIESRCLIGMGATLLNGARIGEGSIVAARALVAEGMIVPPRSLVMGLPARVKREVTEEELEGIRRSAAHYVAFKDDFLAEVMQP
jgi:carbonic anhydrase/acetyltransferase-like protein (isoleucine patch superfamily)